MSPPPPSPPPPPHHHHHHHHLRSTPGHHHILCVAGTPGDASSECNTRAMGVQARSGREERGEAQHNTHHRGGDPSPRGQVAKRSDADRDKNTTGKKIWKRAGRADHSAEDIANTSRFAPALGEAYGIPINYTIKKSALGGEASANLGLRPQVKAATPSRRARTPPKESLL